jgi:hypothetical protein
VTGSRLVLTAIASLAVLIAGCQTKPKANVTNSAPAAKGKSASLRTMEQVAQSAYRCWFESKDKAFRSYQFANELDSHSGTPRILLVPAKNYGGLPALVIQARGNSSRVENFGPLLNQPLGARVNADVARWASGDPSCGSSA